MILTTDEVAVKIEATLSSQRFANWYNKGVFDNYLTHDKLPAPTKEEILKEIIHFFRLNEEF